MYFFPPEDVPRLLGSPRLSLFSRDSPCGDVGEIPLEDTIRWSRSLSAFSDAISFCMGQHIIIHVISKVGYAKPIHPYHNIYVYIDKFYVTHWHSWFFTAVLYSLPFPLQIYFRLFNLTLLFPLLAYHSQSQLSYSAVPYCITIPSSHFTFILVNCLI